MTRIKQDVQKMKKKKKKTKLSTRNKIESNYCTANLLKCNTQLMSVPPKKILYSEISDKYLNSDKMEDTYLHKDTFSTHISIPEVEKGLTFYRLKKKKKKKKRDKKREENNEKIKKKKAVLMSDEFYTETCDDIYKNSSKDIIGSTNLNKDELATCNSISNASEGRNIDFLLKSPSKKYKKSKIATEEETEMLKDKTKNKIHKKRKYLNKVIANDCSKKINIDTEMINITHKSRISKVHKDSSELLHKLLKKKKKKAIKEENNEKIKKKKAVLMSDEFYTKTCDDTCKNSSKNIIGSTNLNKDKAVTHITMPINSINEDEYTRLKRIVKKIKKEKKKNQQIQLINNLKNENNPIHTNKRVYSKKELNGCNEMLLDFNEAFKEIHNLATTSLCIDDVNVLKSPSKKIKKIKIATEEKTETLKDESKNKTHKKKKYLNKVIADDCSKEINIDTEMINITHKSRISKVHKDPSKLLHKLLKKKKKTAIKAEEVSTEKMLPKKSNKSKRQTTDEEYSTNSYPRSVDMPDKRTYDNNDRVPSDDSERNLEIPVAWDDHKSKYRAIADTDLYFSGHYTEESNIAYSSTNHENVHIGKSSHGCDVCFRTFISKFKLCIHKRTHTGEKPYACNVCGQSFSLKSSVVRHNRTHTGEKPYTCDVCGRSFTLKFNLATHNRTHTGEKPYACNVCGQCFSEKSSLVKHNRTHTGEKPYACGYCEKKFSQSNNRLNHIRNVHFKCF